MRKPIFCALLLTAAIGSPAFADPDDMLRSLCPTRPGMATPPCIVDSGHALAELGLVDWTLDKQGSDRTDTVVAGDLLLRFGIDKMSEVQIGLTGFGSVRSRIGGVVSRVTSIGDMTLAYKRSLMNPDGSGVSVAVQPFVTLPTGGSAIGAGDWGAGFILPVGAPLTDKISLEFTPEVDAAVNSSGSGRHFAVSAVEGLSFTLSSKVSAALEVQEVHDADPSGHQDHALAGLAVAFQPSSNWQLDMGSIAGLDRNSPDIELYVGISRRF